MTSFSIFRTQESLITDEGFGPLFEEDLQLLFDVESKGATTTKKYKKPLRLTDNEFDEDLKIILVQSSKIVLFREDIVDSAEFSPHVPLGRFDVYGHQGKPFGVFCAVRPKLNDDSGMEWLNFQKSEFDVAVSISVGARRPLKYERRKVVFTSSNEYKNLKRELSGFDKLVPGSICLNVKELPGFLQFGRYTYFNESVFCGDNSTRSFGLEKSGSRAEVRI